MIFGTIDERRLSRNRMARHELWLDDHTRGERFQLYAMIIRLYAQDRLDWAYIESCTLNGILTPILGQERRTIVGLFMINCKVYTNIVGITFQDCELVGTRFLTYAHDLIFNNCDMSWTDPMPHADYIDCRFTY